MTRGNIYVLLLVFIVVVGLSFNTNSGNVSIGGVGFLPVDSHSEFHSISCTDLDGDLFHRVNVDLRVPRSGEVLFKDVLLLVNNNSYPVTVMVVVHNKRVVGISRLSLLLRDRSGRARSVDLTGSHMVSLYVPPESSLYISFLVGTHGYMGSYVFTVSFYFT